MPITRPTLQQLVSRITVDIQTAAGLTAPLLPNSVLRILAKVVAAANHSLFGFIAFYALQIFPDTATSEFLSRWAAIWGFAREPATFAQCVLTVTGVDGSDVPEGTVWVNASGIEYSSDADAVIDGDTAIAVTALTAGALGTPAAGDTPALVAPVVGVDASATVAVDGIVPGVDTETDANLLTRLLARIQTPPQGGALSDYVAWARSVAGVTRAWPYPGLYGPGTVGLTFATDGEDSPIPTDGVVAEVQAYIDIVRPVTAAVTVFAPDPLTVDFTIALDGSTADLRAAIAAALAAYVIDAGFPGETLLLTQIASRIAENSGGNDFDLTVPAANVVVGATEMAVMGIITWA